MLRIQTTQASAAVAAVADARRCSLAESHEAVQVAQTAMERARAETDSLCSRVTQVEEERKSAEVLAACKSLSVCLLFSLSYFLSH